MPALDGRRVALIGGAGFIGHNMAIAMQAQGAHVEVIDGLEVNHLAHFAALPPDNPNRGLYIAILLQRLDRLHTAGVRLRRQDARDYHGLSQHLNEIAPDTIVHLAAVAHANRSNKDPFSTFDHSMRTLENALDWARGAALQRFVFFSSSMVYGNFRTPSVSEDHPLEPIGIYGALKVGGEKLVIAYNQVFDMPYTIVRPSALYGPRCVSRRVGQAFIESALVGDTLRVDGAGDERLDFTYIDDVVDGVIRCITHEKARDETFNMTSGRARTLRELVTLVQDHFPEIEVEYVERDALRPHRGTLDMTKARELIGHVPGVTLEDGLGRYVEWYREVVAQRPLTGVAGDVREDGWLGARLGRPAHTLEAGDSAHELEAGFYQAKVDCEDVAHVRALENAGFRVVDVSLTLRREPGQLDAPGAVMVAGPAHRAAVMEIAEHGFTTSRFHLDPEIPDAAAAAIKRDWAAALCDGERGETLLVVEADGTAVGFLGLLADSVIDLIAVRPDARRSGVGRALVAAVSGSALTVGTQAANVGALRFYERLGFETIASRYVLHLHRI